MKATPDMEDLDLAYEIATRLNRLIRNDPNVLRLVNSLIETRVNVPEALVDHPTIQVITLNDGVQDFFQVGFLGLLNGIIGVQPEGLERAQWGYLWSVDEEKFSVVPNTVTVSELLANPRMDSMFKVTGKVAWVQNVGTTTVFDLVDGGQTLRCGVSKKVVGDEFPILLSTKVGQFDDTEDPLTLYGRVQYNLNGDVRFQVVRQFP